MKNEQNGKFIFWQLLTDLCEHQFFLLKIEQMIYLWIMKTSIPQQFRVALNHLLQLEGRGAQVRLSTAQNIDRGYLNAIIKGRKPGAEDIRVRIATHFGMTYEEMLALGRRSIEDKAGSVAGLEFSTQPLGGKIATDCMQVAQETSYSPTIAGSIKKVLEIFESRTKCSNSLAEVIDTYHYTISTTQDNQRLTSRLKELEDRMRQMEGKLLTKNVSKKKKS